MARIEEMGYSYKETITEPKEESMRVRIDGGKIENRRLMLGIETQEEAARLIKCHYRTYQRAISGDKVELQTLNKICKAFGLKREEILLLESKNSSTLLDEIHTKPQYPEAVLSAFNAANDAMLHKLNRNDARNLNNMSMVFSALLHKYGKEIAEKDPIGSLLFIDMTFNLTRKAMINTGLFHPKLEDTTKTETNLSEEERSR